ncbi:MAG: hypothetical protein K0M45_10855 [Candidatus Paracaedibacteraceae bacterium]|nr:hypothetical protein [Candidatus Paracaedibacteraceae bacterium]
MTYKKSLAVSVSFLSLMNSPYANEWNDNKENLIPWGQNNTLQNFTENHTCPSLPPYSNWNMKSTNQDSFSWQNLKHYEQLTELFKNLANRELSSIIIKLIDLINNNASFFSHTDKVLIEELQETVFKWLMDDVLTYSNFNEDHRAAPQDTDSEMDMDDDEDDWRRSYMEGFYGGNSDNEEDGDGYYESGEEDYYEELAEKDDDEAFYEWQKRKLWEMLNIDVMDMDDFTHTSIDRSAIKRFLERHCEGGYSWLINEVIEGSFRTSEDFVNKISSQIDVPQALLSNIFGSLWFDYDWEEFDFDDPNFIAKTYNQTLSDLLDNERAGDVKSGLLNSLQKLFVFNGSDFDSPFNAIPSRYKKYVDQNNWLKALIEWSVYTTYQKVFENPAKKSNVTSYKTSTPALPVLSHFHKETYLTSRLEAAYERAQESYTKVYPHLETRYLVYGKADSPTQARLDLQQALGNLKYVGKHLEPHRKGKKTANVFVPALFFIVSSQSDKNSPKHFLEVPLTFENLPRRPLTCHTSDKVFESDYSTDPYYFDQVKHDVIIGKVIQGYDAEEAEKNIEELIHNEGLCNPQLVHSERVLVEILKNPLHIETLCNNLVSRLRETFGPGLYKVHGGTLLGYSTNTICPNCTPTLLSWQNSKAEDQFLSIFTAYINNLKGDVQCYTKGYNPHTNMMEGHKFRLNTFITASINFDPQANDLADAGQHAHTKNKCAPKKTHNPHAKLFFPQDEINLSQLPLADDNTPEKLQRFFYEFVGKDIHPTTIEENPYFKGNKLAFPGIILSSGSEPWGHNLMQ